MDSQAAHGAGGQYPKGGDLCRRSGPEAWGADGREVEDWREKFLLGAENAMRSRPRDEEALKDEQIKTLKQKIRDLMLDNDMVYGRP